MTHNDHAEIVGKGLESPAVAGQRPRMPGRCHAPRGSKASLKDDQLPAGIGERSGRAGEKIDVNVLEVRADGQIVALCAK